MNRKTSWPLFLWSYLGKLGQTGLKIFKQSFRKFEQKYPNSVQPIQLTFLYFFALIDLMYSIFNTIINLGYSSAWLKTYGPFIENILQSPILKLMFSPEKVFFFSYIVIELMVIRSTFQFSKLIRYNILLIFTVLMIQGLVISYCDLFFTRDITSPGFEDGFPIEGYVSLSLYFFIFSFFFLGYVFFYSTALKGKTFVHPKLTWLTNSVSFWLKIRTGTMDFGYRKKKNNK